MFMQVVVSEVGVRHGVLLLTGSNTVVLGGQVPHLVALEQKKRDRWERNQKYLCSALLNDLT